MSNDSDRDQPEDAAIAFGYFKSPSACGHRYPRFVSADGLAVICAGCGHRGPLDWLDDQMVRPTDLLNRSEP